MRDKGKQIQIKHYSFTSEVGRHLYLNIQMSNRFKLNIYFYINEIKKKDNLIQNVDYLNSSLITFTLIFLLL